MKSISRRNLFKYGVGAVGVGGAVGLGGDLLGVGGVAAKTVANPDAAIEALNQGNQRFSQQQKNKKANSSVFRLREVAKGQKPFAAVLGCADSRVPVEILFDQGLGDLFVVRVAGNVATPEEVGSLEFGTAVLGAKVVLVLGHERCGAVDAAIKGKPVPGKIGSILTHIKPAVTASENQSGDRLRNATIANIKNQITELQGSPVLADLIKAGSLKIIGGFYDLDTGIVTTVA
jgi:carbonic anhydrase